MVVVLLVPGIPEIVHSAFVGLELGQTSELHRHPSFLRASIRSFENVVVLLDSLGHWMDLLKLIFSLLKLLGRDATQKHSLAFETGAQRNFVDIILHRLIPDSDRVV